MRIPSSENERKRVPDRRRPRLPRLFTLNIGTVVFGILFIYIIGSVILYMTRTHVSSYTVTSGPLAKNQTYTGVALYDETLVSAEAGGYIDYYARDGVKVRSGGVVYGVSPTKKTGSAAAPDQSTLSAIRTDMKQFSETFDPVNFHTVYSLRYQVEGRILNAALSGDAGASSGSLTVGDETLYTAPSDGIVCYSTDGYESLDEKKLTSSVFDEKEYRLKAIKTGSGVTTGDPVYRLIRSEKWSLLLPLTAKQAVSLADLSYVKVKFLKDGVSQNASFSIHTMHDGTQYGRLDFSNGLIRYLDNRYIEIELVTNTAVGLKVPVSAVVTRSFFTIPDGYASDDGGSTVAFLRQMTDRTGKVTYAPVRPTIYAHENGAYYVDDSDFSPGDIIVRDETSASNRYIVRDTAELEGVYSMNRGYALFRRVNIIDKNEDYCIVESGTAYGIARFDNIVEHGSSVKNAQITAG